MAIDIRNKAFLDGLVEAVEAEIAPLAARKAEINQERAALVAEERQIDKAIDAWRGGLEAAKKARDALFPPA